MTCAAPETTRRIVNPGTGPLAWCGACQRWRPAEQVPCGQERRDSTGKILATYAAKPHEKKR